MLTGPLLKVEPASLSSCCFAKLGDPPLQGLGEAFREYCALPFSPRPFLPRGNHAVGGRSGPAAPWLRPRFPGDCAQGTEPDGTGRSLRLSSHPSSPKETRLQKSRALGGRGNIFLSNPALPRSFQITSSSLLHPKLVTVQAPPHQPSPRQHRCLSSRCAHPITVHGPPDDGRVYPGVTQNSPHGPGALSGSGTPSLALLHYWARSL